LFICEASVIVVRFGSNYF